MPALLLSLWLACASARGSLTLVPPIPVALLRSLPDLRQPKSVERRLPRHPAAELWANSPLVPDAFSA